MIKINICGVEYNLSEGSLDSVLNHSELARVPERYKGDNAKAFRSDFRRGVFKNHDGFVAYQSSIPCGLGEIQKELYYEASAYHGGSSLAVFAIPSNEKGLEGAIRTAVGRLRKDSPTQNM